MKKPFLLLLILASLSAYAQPTIVHYLSGTDKDHTVQWDFRINTGMNSGKWAKIAVPSCWEQQGFGTFNYYEDKINPEEKGEYRYAFSSDPAWKGKKIFIVFDGSMTDTEVKINGRSAGPVHQGAFYQFRYDVTDLLQEKSDHLLEVTVHKKSGNNSINRAERQADFWLFGGIFRPVFLEIVPQTFIERTAVDAKANGTFGMQVFTQGTKKGQRVAVQLAELNGKLVGKPMVVAAADSAFVHGSFSGVRQWNPEQPYLYKAIISIKEGTKTIHTSSQRFGFRTVAFKERDGFYVNGTKVIFKGVCRHSHWPESGRTLSRGVHLMDIRLMKEMNMNAVRMSHYPPDREFLDLCDSLGLFVLDELTGWQKAYDTVVGRRLVKEMVLRDVNHPSIVIWDNGNEGGWNRALDNDFHLYDPQKRFVMHPWEKFRGTETKHYPDFNYITNAALYGDEVFYPTEFMHGLFDGGHGAGLEDFWNEMQKHRGFAGGFLWALHDEGAVRTDKGGVIDVAGNSAPDGIVGPHREREGSFYTIRELWSPVAIDKRSLPPGFDGKLQVQNRYLYTHLDKCTYAWKLVSFAVPGNAATNQQIIRQGKGRFPAIAPGGQGWLHLPLPASAGAQALYLTAFDEKDSVVCTWSWPLVQPGDMALQAATVPKVAAVVVQAAGASFSVSCDGIAYGFDTTTGFLQKVVNGGKDISLSGGPALAKAQPLLLSFTHYREGDQYIIQPTYEGGSYKVKWIFESGKLPKLEYSYTQKGPADFMGITFNFPEAKITGMQWMGRGPYRVWKNRLRGQQFGVWQKAYNNTVTGESWNYPEFKGWHADLYRVTIQNKEKDFTVYTDRSNIFLQMLQPQKPKGATNENTSPPFPQGSIGFMHAISAIGTKFQAAELLGPQSQKNMQLNYTPITGALYFDFR